MDKRKLIGTIIGVIMFAALIVGATYAWLSFNANVTNTVANGTTLTYWVDYGIGTELRDVPILVSGTKETAAIVTVTARRPERSIADNIQLYLTTTSTNSVSKDGIVKYIVCVDDNQYSYEADDYTCDDNNFSGREIQSVKKDDDGATVQIYSGKLPIESDEIVEYNVYFWIDAATLTNDHIGDEYSGYIHAASEQAKSTTYK